MVREVVELKEKDANEVQTIQSENDISIVMEMINDKPTTSIHGKKEILRRFLQDLEVDNAQKDSVKAMEQEIEILYDLQDVSKTDKVDGTTSREQIDEIEILQEFPPLKANHIIPIVNILE